MSMFGQVNPYSFGGPDFNQGNNTGDLVRTVLPYQQSQQDKQMQFQKDLVNMQRTNRIRDLAQQMNIQQQANQPTPSATRASALNPNPAQFQGSLTAGGGTVFKDEIDPYHMALLSQKDRQLAIQQANNAMRNDIGQQNVDIRSQLANNPNYQAVRTRGGDVQYIDRKTGKVVDTGIDSGTMTQEAELTKRGQNATQLEQTRETGREKLEGVRQGNRAINLQTRGGQAIANIEAQGRQARETKSTPSGTKMPAQERIGQQMVITQIENEHPELKGFATIDPNTGMVNIAQGGGMFGGGPTPDQRQFILDRLYPGGLGGMATGQPQAGTRLQSAPVPEPVPQAAPQGNVPAQTQGIPEGAQVQRSPSSGHMRYSTDGGKTWTVVGGG